MRAEGLDARVRAIQETAVHIFAAQAVWRTRLEGVSPTTFLDPGEYPTPLALRFAFGAERARFSACLETVVDDSALERVVAYQTMNGDPFSQPVGEILQHVLLHSMYHRGQITARLIDLGHESALLPTDLIVYQREGAQG